MTESSASSKPLAIESIFIPERAPSGRFTNVDFTSLPCRWLDHARELDRAPDAGSAIDDLSPAQLERKRARRFVSLVGARTWPDVATGAGAGSLVVAHSRSRDPGDPAVAAPKLALSAAPCNDFRAASEQDRKEDDCTSRPLIFGHSSRCPRMS